MKRPRYSLGLLLGRTHHGSSRPTTLANIIAIALAYLRLYPKHLPKADVHPLVATGQKVIGEMPAIVAKSMQAAYPIMSKRMNALIEHMRQRIAQQTGDSKPITDHD